LGIPNLLAEELSQEKESGSCQRTD